MNIDIDGSALVLLEDFLYYGYKYPAELADTMYYEHDAFKSRLKRIQDAYDKSKQKKGENYVVRVNRNIQSV